MKKIYPNTYSNAIVSQQGATLIIVLMVVLLLSLVGAIAVRSSQVTTDITTSAQVNQLLLQSSDVPLAKLEISSIEDSTNDTSMTRLEEMALENVGPIGVLTTPGRENEEYILCYQPTERDSLYSKGKHLIIVDTGGSAITGDSDGYCQLDSRASFTSARQAVATQIAITRPTVNESMVDDVGVKPLEVLNLGMDGASVGKSEAAYIRVHSTSVLPALAITSSSSDIADCLKKPIGGLAEDDQDKSQVRCLDVQNAPINIQVQDYAYNVETE